MKRLDIIVRFDKVIDVIDAINKVGVGGMSVTQILGQGAADSPLVGPAYSRQIITTVVDDSQVNQLKSVITNAARSKGKGDGKIFVTDVEDALDISTGKTGRNAI